MPAPAELAEIVAHIDQVIDRQQPAQTKTLIESLVAEVKVVGPNQVIPIFRVPQPRGRMTRTERQSHPNPHPSRDHRRFVHWATW